MECTGNEHCTGKGARAFCFERACIAPGLYGSDCDDDEHCASDICSSDKCVDCTDHDHCPGHQHCLYDADSDKEKKCAADIALGAPCDDDEECATHRCHNPLFGATNVCIECT